MGSLSLIQGIFPTQGSNPGLLHCRRILYQLSHREAQLIRALLKERQTGKKKKDSKQKIKTQNPSIALPKLCLRNNYIGCCIPTAE